MKKIFGALMIAVCIGMAMPAQAQIHFGVKGGLNLSKASFSNVESVSGVFHGRHNGQVSWYGVFFTEEIYVYHI